MREVASVSCRPRIVMHYIEIISELSEDCIISVSR